MQTLADMRGVGVKNRGKYADVLCGRPLGKTHFIVMPLITKFCTHRFLSPIVGNVGIFETIEGVEELFDQTSEIAEIQESMGVCRIRRRMVG